MGDRVRLYKDDDSKNYEEDNKSDYFTGIVLDGNVNKATDTLVLWDKRKTSAGKKDRKRYKTKGFRSEIYD